MINWRKALEADLIFNKIVDRIISEFPGEDIKVELEINTSTKEGNLIFDPGYEWLFGYNKSWRHPVAIGWQFRLKRKSMTKLMGGKYAKWTIDASVLSKIYVNEWGPNNKKIILETWNGG